jgi:transcriptional regulator with XRE-family HTH domain
MEKLEMSELPTPEGRLLRAWRKARRLSQDALGAAVKKGGDKSMDGALLGHYERGTHRPSIDQLLDIVLALGVPGANEEERLARFFAGPDATLISVAEVERDLADLNRLRGLERQLGELLAAGKGAQ